MPKTYLCETCQKPYNSSRGLRKHYQKNLDHHKSSCYLKGGNAIAPAKEQVENFLNVAEKYKYSRIKEFLNTLT